MPSSFRGAWQHRRWRWLLASFAVSSIGDFLYFVALLVFLIESTGSPSWVAAAAVARLLAYAFFGSLGGVIADVVFREGDDTDDLFVILEGAVTVQRAGVGEASRLGRDDWFGEVGLIRGSPRNATVSAVEDLELLVISGRVFLDALTTNEVLPDPLRFSLAARTPTPAAEQTRTVS